MHDGNEKGTHEALVRIIRYIHRFVGWRKKNTNSSVIRATE